MNKTIKTKRIKKRLEKSLIITDFFGNGYSYSFTWRDRHISFVDQDDRICGYIKEDEYSEEELLEFLYDGTIKETLPKMINMLFEYKQHIQNTPKEDESIRLGDQKEETAKKMLKDLLNVNLLRSNGYAYTFTYKEYEITLCDQKTRIVGPIQLKTSTKYPNRRKLKHLCEEGRSFSDQLLGAIHEIILFAGAPVKEANKHTVEELLLKYKEATNSIDFVEDEQSQDLFKIVLQELTSLANKNVELENKIKALTDL
jgi:hypothetical protein